jgi:hypothetical protein
LVNTKHLLGAFLVAGVVLAAAAVAVGLFLAEPEQREQEANCPAALPAVSRDPDAQLLVDQVDEAKIAARAVRDNVQFHSILVPINPYPTSFYFVAKGRRPVIVALEPDGKPNAREADVEFRGPPGEPLTLDDLMLGPGRAANAVHARYPAADLTGLSLLREDCELVWNVVGFLDGRPPLELLVAVDNATGEVTLPDGPPAPIGPVR